MGLLIWSKLLSIVSLLGIYRHAYPTILYQYIFGHLGKLHSYKKIPFRSRNIKYLQQIDHPKPFFRNKDIYDCKHKQRNLMIYSASPFSISKRDEIGTKKFIGITIATPISRAMTLTITAIFYLFEGLLNRFPYNRGLNYEPPFPSYPFDRFKQLF